MPKSTPAPPPVRSEFKVFHPLTVRWGDLDPQGVVFNPNYFRFFDDAASSYLRRVGALFPDYQDETGFDIFTVNAEANFRESAVYDDVLEIGVRAGQLGKTSCTMFLAAFRQNAVLADGRLVYVNVDLETRRPAPWPDSLRDRIDSLEKRVHAEI